MVQVIGNIYMKLKSNFSRFFISGLLHGNADLILCVKPNGNYMCATYVIIEKLPFYLQNVFTFLYDLNKQWLFPQNSFRWLNFIAGKEFVLCEAGTEGVWCMYVNISWLFISGDPIS